MAYIDEKTLIDMVEESYKKNPHQDAVQRQMHNHEHRHFFAVIGRAPHADVVPRTMIDDIFVKIDGITDLFAKGLIGELEMYDKLTELKKKYVEGYDES